MVPDRRRYGVLPDNLILVCTFWRMLFQKAGQSDMCRLAGSKMLRMARCTYIYY